MNLIFLDIVTIQRIQNTKKCFGSVNNITNHRTGVAAFRTPIKLPCLS